jgi:hypothetical protein
MSTSDCFIFFGPLLALVGVMLVGFGWSHWMDVTGRW